MLKKILYAVFFVVIFESELVSGRRNDPTKVLVSPGNGNSVQVANGIQVAHSGVQVSDQLPSANVVQVSHGIQVANSGVQVSNQLPSANEVQVAHGVQVAGTFRKRRHVNNDILRTSEIRPSAISLALKFLRELEMVEEDKLYQEPNNIIKISDITVVAPSPKQKRSHPLELFRSELFKNIHYNKDTVGIRNIEDINVGAGESRNNIFSSHFRSNIDDYGSKDYRSYGQGGRSQFHVPHKSINSDSDFQSRPDFNNVPIVAAAGTRSYVPIQNVSTPNTL